MMASRKSMCTIISLDLEIINVCLHRLSNMDKNNTFGAERLLKKYLDPHKKYLYGDNLKYVVNAVKNTMKWPTNKP